MEWNWEGVLPALTTKFTSEDQLDLELFRLNLQAQRDAGVSGVILGGTLGEASTLEAEELSVLTRLALKEIGEELPVIVNIAESSTRNALIAVERAAADGASGLMLLPPMRYHASEREALEYLTTVARATSLPVILYNNPVDYKTEISLGMMEVLLEETNIEAVKESTRDLTNITRLKNAFGDRLKVLCGVDTLALESLLMGADGWVAGLVCAFPRETVVLYELARQGRLDEARSIYRWFMPLLELDIDPRLVQNIKLAEAVTGLGSEFVRPPRLSLQGEARNRVKRIVDLAMASRPQLPDTGTLQNSNS